MIHLAIIPARGGSKRLPRKNIREFHGRPIIGWSITAALESGLFDEVMVSTEDAEIAEVAQNLGAAVPFLRSRRNADDHATTTDVIREVLECHPKAIDAVCCIYPTAPFISPDDLAEGLRLLRHHHVVLPVCRFSYPIWRSLSRSEDGRVALNFPEHAMSRSQDLPAAYHDAGQWLWLRADYFMSGGALLGPETGSVVLPAERVQDIDTEEDWVQAEAKFAQLMGADAAP